MNPFQLFLDFLCPPRCTVCAQLLAQTMHQDEITRHARAYFCSHCDPGTDQENLLVDLTRSDSSDNLCPRCGERRPCRGYKMCTICELAPLPLQSVYSIWRYTGPIVPAIKAYKYSEQLPLRRYFSVVLLHAAKKQYFRNGDTIIDFVVPIPSTPESLRKRGYHHTQLLAGLLARALGIPSLPRLLSVRAGGIAQARLSPAERRRNIHATMKVRSNLAQKVYRRRLLLIDDILTTGATMLEATRVLNLAGAAVHGLTIARSPHFTSHRLQLGDSPPPESDLLAQNDKGW